MAIGVQTDMATPALARYGSDEMRREFLAPSIAGDYVAASASPKWAQARRRFAQDHGPARRRRLGDSTAAKMWTTKRHTRLTGCAFGQHR